MNSDKNRAARNLRARKGILLMAAAGVALIGPVAVGVVRAVPNQTQAQDKAAIPAFDAASVKPHQDTGARNRTRTIEPGRITYVNVTLRELILVGFNVKPYQLSGPDWIQNNTYDLVATAGQPVGVDEIKRMLGPLLAERFHLTFHRDTRQLPVFALVVARGGPKFKDPGDGGEPTFKNDPNGGQFFQNYSMDNFADWLSLPSMGRPVIDHTGLSGVFSFHANLFEVASRDNLKSTMTGFDAFSTLSATLPEQLGLKLESQTAPLEMFVIDHADKVPTPD